MYERRERARRDQVSREKWAVKKREFEIARNLLGINFSTDQIVTTTGLTQEEVESLRGV